MTRLACVAIAVAAAAVLYLAGSVYSATPKVNLNGNMFIYTSHNYDVPYTYTAGKTSWYAKLVKLPWTNGTAGAVDNNFFKTVNNVWNDSQVYSLSNFDVYNHNAYLLVSDNTSGPRTKSVWKVDGTTGTGTKVFVDTGSTLGFNDTMGIDKTTGDIYVASTGDKRGTWLHDANHDGVYQNNASEMLSLTGTPAGNWDVGNYRQDAEFANGSLYFATCDTYDNGHFFSRLNARKTDNTAIACPQTSWPGWPTGSGKWTNGPPFVALGDPNKNGRLDLYASEGASNTLATGRLGHWEDLDNNGIFTRIEHVDNISIGTTARDVEFVTDGTHSMIVYIDSSFNVKFINLADNGAFTTETGTLISNSVMGLSSKDTTWIDLKMDLSAIPEPATMLLVGSGVLGLLGAVRRRRMK